MRNPFYYIFDGMNLFFEFMEEHGAVTCGTFGCLIFLCLPYGIDAAIMLGSPGSGHIYHMIPTRWYYLPILIGLFMALNHYLWQLHQCDDYTRKDTDWTLEHISYSLMVATVCEVLTIIAIPLISLL